MRCKGRRSILISNLEKAKGREDYNYKIKSTVHAIPRPLIIDILLDEALLFLLKRRSGSL